MFEQSILPEGKSRAWVATAALLGQVAVYGASTLVPLAYVEELPRVRKMGSLIAPLPPEATPPQPVPRRAAAAPMLPKRVPVVREFDMSRLTTPTRIPKHAAIIADAEPPPGVPAATDGGYFVAGLPRTDGEYPPPPPPPPAAPVAAAKTAPPNQPEPERIKIGGKLQAAQLVHRVMPDYPELARRANIQGTVELQAVIGKDGKISELHVVNGNPLLAPAAMDAVKRWRYSPTLLNGRPVEVVTDIIVNFTLHGPS